MRRKITFVTLLCAALLLLIPLAAIYFLAYTEAGFRFAVRVTPHKLGPITMDIRGASGTLVDGINVESFDLVHDRVHVHATGIHGRVNVLPLLWQTIDAHDAHIEAAFVQVFPRVSYAQWVPHFLPRFLVLNAAGTRIDKATLIAIGGQRLEGTNIVSTASLRHKSLRVFESTLRMGDLHGSASGELRAAEPMQLTASFKWTYSTASQPVYVFNGDVDGDLQRLNVTAHSTAPFSAAVTGEALQLTNNWHWQAHAVITRFDLLEYGIGNPLGNISGALDAKGDRNGFVARGPLESNGLAVGMFDTQFEGSYADRVLRAAKVVVVHRASKASTTASGEIGVVPHGPRLALQGNWRDFRWPLIGNAPAVRSAAGHWSINGLRPFAVTADGPLVVRELAPIPVQLRGTLDHDKLIFTKSGASLLGGSGLFAGEVAWSPRESWQLAGRFGDLDTALLRPDLPGKVSFNIAASGDAFGDKSVLDVTVTDLTGRVRGANARGAGHIQHRGEDWLFDKVNIAVGGLRLVADGRVGATTDITFKADADDLSLLSANSRGKLTARGTLSGTAELPRLLLNAKGSGISHAGVAISELNADIDVDPHAGKTASADIRVRNLEAFGRQIARGQFVLRGSTEKHDIALSAEAADGNLNARATGGLQGNTWRGIWIAMNVDDKSNLHLQLEKPAPLQVSLTSGRQEQLCLKGSPSRWCSSGDWDAAGWHADLAATELPLATLTSGLTSGTDLEGVIDFHSKLFAGKDGNVQGELRADLRDAQLRHKLSSGKVQVIKLGSGFVNATADSSAIHAELKLDAESVGSIEGNLRAARTTKAYADYPLSGSGRISTRALGIVSLFVAQIDRAAGKLDAHIDLAGTLGAPRLNGSVAVSDGELDSYQVNLSLRAVTMTAKLNDSSLGFAGSAKAGDGDATASGQITWRNGLPYGSLKLSGNNLSLVNVPEARIRASPDLELRIDGRKINVGGEVKVPYARIAPADLTGAVLSSSDEVLEGQPVVAPESRTQITSNIRLLLGDQVSVDTFGLSGRLTGNLRVDSAVDGTTRGSGELNIADGKYAAFGRRLDVERGRLIFGGGLIADPGIDIRATKRFPDVVAGVNVRGTLRAPRMTFFSDPSLPQSQIVSLILAGGSLETAQNSNRSGAASSALLAQGGAIIAQQLGAKVGIDDVGIEQDLTNSTSLVLGKYLSPRLYVSYGISLAESINTIKMRYTLGDRWTIKTEAGKERSADLVYTIEK